MRLHLKKEENIMRPSAPYTTKTIIYLPGEHLPQRKSRHVFNVRALIMRSKDAQCNTK